MIPSTQGCIVFFIFTGGINSESFSQPVHSVPYKTPSPKFLRRRTRVESTADNADISHSQTASDDRLLSHVTIAASNAGSICQHCGDADWLFFALHFCHFVSYYLILLLSSFSWLLYADVHAVKKLTIYNNYLTVAVYTHVGLTGDVRVDFLLILLNYACFCAAFS